jgi:adenylate cyclase
VKAVFSKIVSPNVVNELLNVEKLSLGGARRNITVFFADVRGFTEMTDLMQARAEEYVRETGLTGDAAEAYFDEQARQTLATVNTYLSTIADKVKEHYGTLDKYIGDCVMAFWGAPTPNEKHALCCVRAAIDAQRGMHALNQERTAENKRREVENVTRIAAGQRPLDMLPLLSLGSGINTGTVIVGLMGSDAHILNYTVFGRDVNVASRLEGVSGRGRIIIGETTFRDIQRDDLQLAATCVELPAVTVKGIKNAVKIYEVPWKTGSDIPKAETAVPASLETAKS